MIEILDVCCGPRSMWFDKDHPGTVFGDRRSFGPEVIWRGMHRGKPDQRTIQVRPSVQFDWRALPFRDGSFALVVMDPPHLRRSRSPTDKCWLAKRYGHLGAGWSAEIRTGFDEAWRVLRAGGTLVFKWCEVDVPTSKVIEVLGRRPLFGHVSGKASKTHWLCFLKGERPESG